MNNPRHYQIFSRINGTSPVRLLNNAYSIRWGLRLGKAGILDVVLPARGCTINPLGDQAYDLNDFSQNHWIELYRTYGVTGVRTRVGPAPFLISSVELEQTDDGLKVITLHAETPLSVLSRRINPYDSTNARSDFPPTPADDFMKEVVRNNFGPTASSHVNAPGYAPDPLRDASAVLQVQANVGVGAAAYEAKVENADLLRAIQSAADFSQSNGIALFFDIFATGGAVPFEFRTMINAYGVDRSVVGPNQIKIHNNLDLSSYNVGFDWTSSSNRIYAGGKGATGAARIYAVSPVPASAPGIALTASVAADPFSLREKFESSTGDNLASVQSEADAARVAANTVFRSSGKFNENGRLRYGIDFDFGDKLQFIVDTLTFPAFVVSEVGQLRDAGEEILEVGFNTEPLPRAAAQGVAGVISDLSRITTSLERIARTE